MEETNCSHDKGALTASDQSTLTSSKFDMKTELLKKILDDIKSVKIIVAGDFCLDAYWFIDESMSEISIETGEPTMPVNDHRYSLGGAGNVAANLAVLGAEDIYAFGVIGPDPFGTEMVRIMKETGINTEYLIKQEKEWITHTYAKPYTGDKELNRIDFGNFNRLSKKTADLLVSNLMKMIPLADAVIINQQVASGIHTDYFRIKLLEVITGFPENIFITDSRNFNDYYDGTIRKMNDIEAAHLCGIIKHPEETVTREEAVTFAGSLFRRFRKPLLITRGSRGSLTIDQSGISDIPGLMILSKLDTVGAGDSYMAGAASALAAGYDMITAATLGSLTAGVTVQKLFQTGTASPDEILALGKDPDYIYNPELAEDIRHAVYLTNSGIEIINKREKILNIKYAIFDHDGTISTLRQGWEIIMAPVMIRAILGDKYHSADETLYKKVKTRVDEYIDMTTGIQTLAQMNGLLRLIREFGCVPETDMLDEYGYKKVYNDELLKMVREREDKYTRGELSLDDLTIKNAVPFLIQLHNAGVRLYLVSGTDEEDVKQEVKTLGYDHLFNGGILGAVGDIKREAKKMVLDEILTSIGETASPSVVTFGDGPVEIRETRKRNGLSIGVASDEIRRYGLNERKRTRLIKAGADFIIPDFSQPGQLLSLLNI